MAIWLVLSVGLFAVMWPILWRERPDYTTNLSNLGVSISKQGDLNYITLDGRTEVVKDQALDQSEMYKEAMERIASDVNHKIAGGSKVYRFNFRRFAQIYVPLIILMGVITSKARRSVTT